MEPIKPQFKKSSHALAIMPSKVSLDLSEFDRKLINVLIKSSIESASPEHVLENYQGKFFGMRQSEIGRRMGLKRMFDYSSLRDSMLKLQHITLSLESPSHADNSMDGAPSRKLLGSVVLLPTVVHEDRKERLGTDGSLMSWWKINEDLSPHLLDPARYTTLRIESITSMRMGASIALYEICARFSTSSSNSTGFKKLDWWIMALTGNLTTGAKRSTTYSEFKYFSRDILRPAVKEVNEKSEIEVLMELKKTGKKVTEIRFIVHNKSSSSNNQKKAEGPGPGSALHPDGVFSDDLKVKAISLGVTEKFFAQVIKNNSMAVVNAAVVALEKEIQRKAGDPKAEVIRSSNAYLRTLIDNIQEEQAAGQLQSGDVVIPKPATPDSEHGGATNPSPSSSIGKILGSARPSDEGTSSVNRFAEIDPELLEEVVCYVLAEKELELKGNPLRGFLLTHEIRNLNARLLTGPAASSVAKRLRELGFVC